ncbi:unnamed protein product [Durusdinium trenchii]|uniref:Uncharacterized protein n=1 Tax=Durusdinium trenchii TaxID=1381693 RepID=A0ABP0QI80_9DINO
MVAGQSLENMEPLKVAKCTPDMTPDGIDLTDQEYLTRFGTVVVFVFLNEIEAADLCFPSLGIQVWSTSSSSPSGILRHQAQPPRSGTRFAAIGSFREKLVRA